MKYERDEDGGGLGELKPPGERPENIAKSWLRVHPCLALASCSKMIFLKPTKDETNVDVPLHYDLAEKWLQKPPHSTFILLLFVLFKSCVDQ